MKGSQHRIDFGREGPGDDGRRFGTRACASTAHEGWSAHAATCLTELLAETGAACSDRSFR